MQQEDVAAGPAEDVGFCVALVKHPWGNIFLYLIFLKYTNTHKDTNIIGHNDPPWAR